VVVVSYLMMGLSLVIYRESEARRGRPYNRFGPRQASAQQ